MDVDKVDVTVVGGHAGTTIMPLLSQVHKDKTRQLEDPAPFHPPHTQLTFESCREGLGAAGAAQHDSTSPAHCRHG